MKARHKRKAMRWIDDPKNEYSKNLQIQSSEDDVNKLHLLWFPENILFFIRDGSVRFQIRTDGFKLQNNRTGS